MVSTHEVIKRFTTIFRKTGSRNDVLCNIITSRRLSFHYIPTFSVLKRHLASLCVELLHFFFLTSFYSSPHHLYLSLRGSNSKITSGKERDSSIYSRQLALYPVSFSSPLAQLRHTPSSFSTLKCVYVFATI